VAAAIESRVALALGSEYYEALSDSLVLANVSMSGVLAALEQALPLRFKLGVLDPAEGQPYLSIGLEAVASLESKQINMLASREGLVLLENPGGILPFSFPSNAVNQGGAGAGSSTLLVGFHGNSVSSLLGNYYNSSALCPDSTLNCFSTLEQTLRERDPALQFSPGCLNASACPETLVQEALARVSSASRIIVTVGLDQTEEREQHDRHSLGLPPQQVSLVAALLSAAKAHAIPVAAVLIHGGPLALDDSLLDPLLPPVALLDAFYPGPFGADAIAAALAGDFSPGGKLPYTVFPSAYVQAVAFTDHAVASLGRTYRYHNASTSPGGAPLWEFGHGRSYADFLLAFAVSPPPPQPIRVEAANFLSLALPLVSVTNMHSGTYRGGVADEVVQAYLVPHSESIRSACASTPLPFIPLKQVAAFQRVTCAPGESVRIGLNITRAAMELTDAAGGRDVRVGSYTVIITRGNPMGAEFDDLKLELLVV